MTRNRIIYAIYAVSSIIFVSYYGGIIPYMLFEVAIMIPIVCFIYILIVYCQLSFYQTTPKKVVTKGEVLPYEVKLINTSFLSFAHVKLDFYHEQCRVEGGGNNKEQSLLPGDEAVLKSSLICFFRGEYEVGACDIEISDFLELFRIKWPVKWPLKLTVLPKIFHVDRLVFLPDIVDPKTVKSNQLSESDTKENELRKYQSGDALKAIHWKASARTRQLLTRKNEGHAKGENHIILDISPTGMEGIDKLRAEDKVLETTLAIGSYLKEHHVSGSIYYSSGRLKAYHLQKAAEFGAFYDDCSQLWFDGDGPMVCLEELINRNDQQGNYMIVCHHLSEELKVYLLGEKAKQNHFIILLIAEESLSEKEKEELSYADVRFYHIGYEDDLQKILEKSEG